MDDLRITDLIGRERIVADLTSTTRDEALREMAQSLCADMSDDTRAAVYDSLLQRERLASTGIGDEVAIPHGKLSQLRTMIAGLARSRCGIDFGAIDGQLTRLFFVVVAPASANGLHLRALARVARLCKSREVRMQLLEAEDPEAMYEVLDRADADASSGTGRA